MKYKNIICNKQWKLKKNNGYKTNLPPPNPPATHFSPTPLFHLIFFLKSTFTSFSPPPTPPSPPPPPHPPPSPPPPPPHPPPPAKIAKVGTPKSPYLKSMAMVSFSVREFYA